MISNDDIAKILSGEDCDQELARLLCNWQTGTPEAQRQQALVVSNVYLARIVEQASLEINAAIKTAANASSKHAGRLVFATWVLALATVALFVATLILAFHTP